VRQADVERVAQQLGRQCRAIAEQEQETFVKHRSHRAAS
jgi:hypothetical protein